MRYFPFLDIEGLQFLKEHLRADLHGVKFNADSPVTMHMEKYTVERSDI